MLRLVLFATLMMGTSAPAQVVGDIDVIASLMRDYGLIVEKSVDHEGDPLLSTRLEGTHFGVYFYDCDPGPCSSIQFSAGFNMDNPLEPARIAEWNREKRFGKAYLDDEGDPFIEVDINLAADGIGRRNFEDSLDLWRAVLADFRNFIDW